MSRNDLWQIKNRMSAQLEGHFSSKLFILSVGKVFFFFFICHKNEKYIYNIGRVREVRVEKNAGQSVDIPRRLDPWASAASCETYWTS